jgi:hypothetical protein
MVSGDVHWSDPTTRESLGLLIDRVPTLRVVVIITFRPEFAPPWIGRPHVTVLTLNRLPPRQRAEMIAYVTGGKTLPREIADQIVDRTDGVPLFIAELTKTVLESGIVTDAGDRNSVTGPVAFSEGNAADPVFSDVVVGFEPGVGGESSDLRVFCCASTETNARAPFLLDGIRSRLRPVGMTLSLITRMGVTSMPSCANNSRFSPQFVSVAALPAPRPKAVKPMIFSLPRSPKRGAGALRSPALSPSGPRRVRTM